MDTWNRQSLMVGVAILALGMLGMPSMLWAQPKNSIRYAREAKVAVRCGPGDDFYVASYLKQGAAVEVHHRTKDGWCGIRPPEGSYCWLAAENAYLLPGGTTAEVVGKKVPAWIAAAEGNPRQLRWQIELQPTQQVSILGEAKQRIDSDTERLWYRIAPPPGEFRWVHKDMLSEEPLVADPTYPPLMESDAADAVLQASAQDGESRSAARKKKSTVSADPQVTTAQYQEGTRIVRQHTEPFELHPGEELVDEGVVVSDRVVGESEGEMVGDVVEGDLPDSDMRVLDGEEYVDEVEYDAHPAHHGVRHSATERLLVRPLNGILGWIGFGIAEADVEEPMPGYFDRSMGNQLDRSTAMRMEQLPRPNRRFPSHSSSILMDTGSNASPRDGLVNQALPRPRGMDRSGFASGSYGMSGTPAIGSGLMEPERWSANDSYQSGANAQVDSQRSMLGISNSHADWHAATGRAASTYQSANPPGISNATSYEMGRSPASSVSYQSPLSPSGTGNALQLSTPQLRETFFELTRIVSQPTEKWDLRAVHQIATQWVDKGPTAVERGEARLLLERINEFESLRQKWVFQGVGSQNVLANHLQPVTGEAEVPAAVAQQADASGWLSRVHTSRPGQPEFALTDANGNVVTYVTAAPGMNLRRFTEQPVAIYGMKGYLPELAARQIVADRVVRIR